MSWPTCSRCRRAWRWRSRTRYAPGSPPTRSSSSPRTRTVEPAAYAEYLKGLSKMRECEQRRRELRSLASQRDRPLRRRGRRSSRAGARPTDGSPRRTGVERNLRRPRRAAAQPDAGAPERGAGARARSHGGERPHGDGEGAVRRTATGRAPSSEFREGRPLQPNSRRLAVRSSTSCTRGASTRRTAPPARAGAVPEHPVDPVRHRRPFCARGASMPRSCRWRNSEQRFPGDALVVLLEAMILGGAGRHAEAVDLLEPHRRALLVSWATTFLQELSWAPRGRASRSGRGVRCGTSKRSAGEATRRPRMRLGTTAVEPLIEERAASATTRSTTPAAGRSTPT